MKTPKKATIADYLKDYKNPYKLDRSDLISILKTFNHLVSASCIEHGVIYTLPYNLGRLGVYKTQDKKNKNGHEVIDWPRYIRTGEYRAYRNKHSEGWRALWK